MLFRGLFSFADSFELRTFWDIDDGSGGGGAGGNAPPDADDDDGGEPAPPKTYTQVELEKIIQARLKSTKRDLKAKDQQLQSLQEQVSALEKKINEPAGEPGKGDGQRELERQRFQREIDTLKQEAETAKQAAKASELRQREVERDAILANALAAVGCIDHDGGRRWCISQIVWDEVEQQWMFSTKAGPVEIADGVAAELPKYLRPPSMQGGGSGIPSGSGRKATAQRELDSEKAKLEDLRKAVRKDPNNGMTLLKYTTQKKKVDALDKQLASVK